MTFFYFFLCKHRFTRYTSTIQSFSCQSPIQLYFNLQVGYVRGLIQSRLDSRETNRPLHDIYNVLHSLAQLLQLEVLHNQTMRLCLERLRDYIRVEEYIPGRALTISYWRELSARDPQHADQGYRLSIQVGNWSVFHIIGVSFR